MLQTFYTTTRVLSLEGTKSRYCNNTSTEFTINVCYHWRVIIVNQCASVSATDEYTCHSVHETQPYTCITADNQLAHWQKSYPGMAPRENWPGGECVKLPL